MASKRSTMMGNDGEATNSDRPATAETTGDPEDASVTLDTVFEILRNHRRRCVLRYLMEHEEPASISQLTEFVASREYDKDPTSITSQERKRIYVALYQSHLPKMDRFGFVEYDRDRGTLELGPAAEYTVAYLDDQATTRPWPAYYLGVVVGSWVLLLGSLGTSLLSPVVAGSIGLVAVMACALLHWRATDADDTGPSFDTPLPGRTASDGRSPDG